MPEKRPRISREELRSLLLTKGQAILQEEGLGSGAVSLTFKKVFDRVEADTGIHLTNASVIRRVWKNQAEFQTDVLAAVAEDENRDEIDRTIGAVAPLLGDSTSRRWRRATRHCASSAGWAGTPTSMRCGSRGTGRCPSPSGR